MLCGVPIEMEDWRCFVYVVYNLYWGAMLFSQGHQNLLKEIVNKEKHYQGYTNDSYVWQGEETFQCFILFFLKAVLLILSVIYLCKILFKRQIINGHSWWKKKQWWVLHLYFFHGDFHDWKYILYILVCVYNIGPNIVCTHMFLL